MGMLLGVIDTISPEHSRDRVGTMPSEASTFRGDPSMEELRRELAEAREQQSATAAILAAISNSPINSYRVFAEIAASAARLCEAYDAIIYQVDGAVNRLVAHQGPVSLGPVGQFTVPLVRGSLTGRVTLERRTIQLADHEAEEVEYPEGTAVARQAGVRTMLAVPLLRAGEAIGVIALRRWSDRSRIGKLSSSRPSPTRPSSPSRTRGCSRPSKRASGS
jgi:GAF domain-containing protein